MSRGVVTMPGLTDADIAAAIDAATRHKPNADPAFRTAEQWAAAWQCHTEYARRRCKKGERAGLMKREQRYADSGARVVPVSHWKFVGAAKRK